VRLRVAPLFPTKPSTTAACTSRRRSTTRKYAGVAKGLPRRIGRSPVRRQPDVTWPASALVGPKFRSPPQSYERPAFASVGCRERMAQILAISEWAAGALIDRLRSAGYFEIRRTSDYRNLLGQLNLNDCCGNELHSVRSAHPPRNCGRRLATKAAIPACASSVLLAVTIESFSASS
jgi:hypothetical protein